MKFGAGSEQREAHRHRNVFERQRFSDGQERLRIGPSRGHVDLMIELVECIPEPLRLLYILVMARGRDQSGRYEAASGMSFDDTEIFLKEFADFLQSDGRHHLWVASPGFGTIVYDRHDVLYAYGPLDKFVGVLQAKGQSGLGQDQDDGVYVPITTLQKKITGQDWLQYIMASASSQPAVTAACGATSA